jgi:sensor histidine kinase YesM
MIEKALAGEIWNNRVVRHTGLWLAAWVAFYLMVRFHEGHAEAVRITTPIMVAGPLPVYAHFVALARFFERRRYVAYAVSLVMIVAVSSVWAEYVYSLFVNDPNSHTSGLGLAVMYLTFSTGFRYFNRGMRQQHRLQETEFKRIQTEMALLRSKVDPHFMMNTLNNLYALGLDGDRRVPELILKLSELMRYLLDTSKQKQVSLTDELQFIQNYVEFEKLRLDEESDIRLRMESEFRPRQLAPMLMIPLVENCFKHGLRGGENGSDAYIHIDIDVDDSRIRFAAENDAATQPAPRDGVGLEILQQRLALLYPHRYKLSTSSEDGVYKAEMILWV